MNVFRRLSDFMALLIRNILNHADEKFYEHYSALSLYRRNEIIGQLENILPELITNGHSAKISVSLCSEDFFSRLNSITQGQPNEQNMQVWVTLLSKLDISMSKYAEYYFSDKEIRGINTNIDQTRIEFLPRVNCFWEHSSRGASHYNGLMNYLHYFYYIDMDKTVPYEIRHLFLPHGTFEKARKRKVLRIGMSPLSNQGVLVIDTEIREDTGYFSVSEVKNSAVLEQTFREVMKEFVRQEVDIGILPEMLGNRQMQDRFAEQLVQYPEDGTEFPSLIVFPSIWEAQHNTVPVFDEMGDIVIQQEKQHGFLYPKSKREGYLEDLSPDRKITLLHCEGVGRIAILVCKDALVTEYLQMVLNVLKVTLLIIPSFSTGNYDFQEVIQSCRVADCCVCWINTCSVANLEGADPEKLENIGAFLRCGRKSGFENGLIPCERKTRNCNGKGMQDCGHCVFLCNLPFG